MPAGYPNLQPAFTVRVDIDAPMQVGGQAGSSLVIVPMVGGTVKSESGFEPAFNGELHGTGYDYIQNDANGGNMRLNVRSQVKTDDGTVIAMYYKGTVKLTDGVKAVLSGSPDAKTTDYGDSFVTFNFETGSDKYKELQNGTYVAAGHFVTSESGVKGVVVEYKVSKVVIHRDFHAHLMPKSHEAGSFRSRIGLASMSDSGSTIKKEQVDPDNQSSYGGSDFTSPFYQHGFDTEELRKKNGSSDPIDLSKYT